MADTVRSVEYYYVTVPDAPGEVQRILSALKDSGVNLVAFLGFPLGGGQSQIDLVPDDPESLREAAERAGATLSDAKRAFLIQGDDRVGAVADTTAKLAEANINVTAAMATGAGSGRYGMILWVAPADYERAADALGAYRRRTAARLGAREKSAVSRRFAATQPTASPPRASLSEPVAMGGVLSAREGVPRPGVACPRPVGCHR